MQVVKESGCSVVFAGVMTVGVCVTAYLAIAF